MKIRVEIEKTESEWIAVVSYAAEGSASLRYVFQTEKAFNDWLPYAYGLGMEHLEVPAEPAPEPPGEGE